MTEGASIDRALFLAYPDALLMVDAKGVIVRANPAATKLLGYSEADFFGMAVDALVPDSVRPRHAEYREAYRHSPRSRPMGGTQTELVARHRDGREVMVEISLSPVEVAGEPYVVAAVRGIADYPRVKQAVLRARYADHVAQVGRLAVDMRDAQAFLQQVPQIAAQAFQADGVSLFMLEPDGQHLRLAGGQGPTGQEPIGWRMPLSPDIPGHFVMTQNQSLVLDDAQTDARFKLPPAFTQAGMRSLMLAPISDHGRPVGLIGVRSREPKRFGGDERNALESMATLLATTWLRAQSEQALQHAQRLESVGQLTGGIAHDFNNLLTVIQGNLQVLEDLPQLEASGGRTMVEAAMRASKRAADLTGKLLAFSRRQALQAQRVDISQMLQSLADMLRRTLDQRVRIDVHVALGCPAVHADAGQLESALLNIAINARDAMPEGGLLSFVAAAQAWPLSVGDEPQPAGGCVAITVADSGSGMTAEVQQRAFEPFFTTKEAGRGTGLGLSTVYGFVRQSRGTISLRSAPGVGTTITLYLPAWQEGRTVQAVVQNGLSNAPAPGTCVLLVEDEPAVRDVMHLFLQAMQCEVQTCVNAEAALELDLGSPVRTYDVLLTDIALGTGLRGTELARRLAQRHPKLAVLLMSGYSQEMVQADGGATLPWELLRKPCSREQLAAALRRALDRAAAA
jgi:PAS domain S-box-containing protein